MPSLSTLRQTVGTYTWLAKPLASAALVVYVLDCVHVSRHLTAYYSSTDLEEAPLDPSNEVLQEDK